MPTACHRTHRHVRDSIALHHNIHVGTGCQDIRTISIPPQQTNTGHDVEQRLALPRHDGGSVEEVARPGEVHGHAGLTGSFEHFLVANRTAGLDNGLDTGID